MATVRQEFEPELLGDVTLGVTGGLTALQDTPAKLITFSGAAFMLLTGFVDAELPAGAINGVNVTFTLANSPVPAASLILVVNGEVFLQGGAGINGYTLAGATITFVRAPKTGFWIRAWYRK